jgi:hypothetical protein
MRITARTFAHIASNSTLVFANTSVALSAASPGVDARENGSASVFAEASMPETQAPAPIVIADTASPREIQCAAPDARMRTDAPASALVAQSTTSITLWDEITSPAPALPGQAPPAVPQPVPVPVPVDAGRDAGTVSA